MRTHAVTLAVAVGAAAALVLGLGLGLGASSCSSFGEGGNALEPAEASSDGPADGGAADSPLDAEKDSFAASDGGRPCDPPVLLDFESPFANALFAEVIGSNDGGTATQQQRVGAGVNGTTSLETTLVLKATSDDGPYASIARTFAITTKGLELELAFDFTLPAQAGLYAATGCGLSFRTGNAPYPRTEVFTSHADFKGPSLGASARDDGGTAVSAFVRTSGELEALSASFHHIALTIVVDDDGKNAHAHYTAGGTTGILDFPLIAPPTSVVVSCGFYGDSAMGTFTSETDNVRFAICHRQP